MAEVAPTINEIAAAKGNWRIIRLVHEEWKPTDKKAKTDKYRTGSGNAFFKAIEGGHCSALDELASSYGCDLSAGLELALRLRKGIVASTIYQLANIVGVHFSWAARHGSLPLLKYVFDACYNSTSRYGGMISAAESGQLEVVKYLHERCSAELVDEEECCANPINCPLVVAIRHGRTEVVEYLYSNGGYSSYSLEEALVAAVAYGPLELVKQFYEDGLYKSAPSLTEAFEYAASGGKVEIMEYLQGLGGCNPTSFEKALVNAAKYGRVEAIEYLYAVHGYEVAPACGNEAFTTAAAFGRLDAVKLLDRKQHVSADTVVDTFKRTANHQEMNTFDGGRIEVMEFLLGKGCISTEKISEAFVAAAYNQCIDVVQYLFAKVPHSPSVIGAAFQEAASYCRLDLTKFLLQTGDVSPDAVEKAFLKAIRTGYSWRVGFLLFEIGCISINLVEKAVQERYISRQMEAILREHLNKHNEELQALKSNKEHVACFMLL
jgi:hypothetical protein